MLVVKPSNTNFKPTQDEQWTELALQAQAGDKRAYNALLKDIAPFIRNYLLKGLANPEWADDITQDVLLSVHKSLRTYSPDRPFRPWLMAIVNFRRTDFLRKHYKSRSNKQTSLDDYDFQRLHVTNPDHAGEYKDIEAALDSLSENHRKIFEMIKVQGFSTKEVANEMGMSESAVKVTAHRAMKKLQKKLK